MTPSSAPRMRDGETAIHCLDRAVHPGTGDDEALSSIRAFRRLTSGATVTYICEQLFGETLDLLVLEDEWEQRFAEQEALIKGLKSENDQLRRGRLAKPKTERAPRVTAPVPLGLNLTDAEWAVVEPILTLRYRTPMIRQRIAAMRWAVTGGTWRGLTPESDTKWTTFYNMHRSWEQMGLWEQIVSALSRVSQ